MAPIQRIAHVNNHQSSFSGDVDPINIAKLGSSRPARLDDKRSAAVDFASFKWQSVQNRFHYTMNEDGTSTLVEPALPTHLETSNVEKQPTTPSIQKIKSSSGPALHNTKASAKTSSLRSSPKKKSNAPLSVHFEERNVGCDHSTDADENNYDIGETLMTPKLQRQFESLFGDSEPTPSMIMKHKMKTAAGKQLIEKQPEEMAKRPIPSSSSNHLVVGAKISPAATDGKKKDAIVKSVKMAKLDKGKALVPDSDETAFLKAISNSKSKTFYQSELHELTELSMTKIIDLTSKFCEKVNPLSLRSKLRLKPTAKAAAAVCPVQPVMTIENKLLFPGDQHPTAKKAKLDNGRAPMQDATVKPSLMTPVMTKRLERQFESLFGDIEPTPSMVMKHQMAVADAGKRLEPHQKMKLLPSSSSRQLVVGANISAATDGKKKVATVKPVMTTKRKLELLLFPGDDGEQQSVIKKTKLDKGNALVPDEDEDETAFLKAFANSKSKTFFKSELRELTGLSMTKITNLTSKFCEKVNASSQRSKLRLKPTAKAAAADVPVKPSVITSRLKRKFDTLFGDDSSEQSTIKKTKLDECIKTKAEGTTFLNASEPGKSHDKLQLSKLISNLSVNSIDRQGTSATSAHVSRPFTGSRLKEIENLRQQAKRQRQQQRCIQPLDSCTELLLHDELIARPKQNGSTHLSCNNSEPSSSSSSAESSIIRPWDTGDVQDLVLECDTKFFYLFARSSH